MRVAATGISQFHQVICQTKATTTTRSIIGNTMTIKVDFYEVSLPSAVRGWPFAASVGNNYKKVNTKITANATTVIIPF